MGQEPESQSEVFSRNQTEKYGQEVEIRLRSRLSPHLCTGYRCSAVPQDPERLRRNREVEREGS